MTVEQWVAKLDARIAELSDEKIMKAAILDITADVVQRVFVEGKNSKNTAIGRYSRKPIYVNPKNSPKKFSPMGKTGSRFKNKKSHKTRYFNGGYANFKTFIGKGDKVNLWLFGELRSDAASVALRKIQGGFDWRLKKDINQKKVEYLTKHFGGTSIFGLTKDERTKFERNVRAEVLRIMNK